MHRFRMSGLGNFVLAPFMDADTGGGGAAGGGAESAGAASSEPAATTGGEGAAAAAGNGETGAADGATITRDDFMARSKFLRGYQEARNGGQKAAEKGTAEKASPVPTADAGKGESGAKESGEPPAGGSKPEGAPSAEKAAADGQPAGQTVKLPDGREATLEEIAEWQKGYMRQKDYTQKTQQLAEERKKSAVSFDVEQAEKALQLQREIERDPVGFLTGKLEEYAEKGIFEPKDEETLKIEDRMRSLEEENGSLKAEVKEKERSAIFEQITSQLAGLEEKAKEDGLPFDSDAVLQFMIDNGVYDPNRAFRELTFDALQEKSQRQAREFGEKIKAAEEEAVNKYLKTKTAAGKSAQPFVGSSSSAAPVIGVNKPSNMKEARKAAMARIMNT